MKLSSISQVIQKITDCCAIQQRVIVAICGAPGAGKTTFSSELQGLLTSGAASLSSQVIAMDGFHLDNDTLTKKGLLSVKGAPNTFDVAAFEDLLKNIANQQQDLWAPKFDRDLEEVIDKALPIKKVSQVIIVEGNYLLLKQPSWRHLKQYFDISIFLEVPQKELQQRLVQRWLDQGYDLASAQQKATDNDLVNGELVIKHSHNADIYLPYN
jgi:pantothenate kinase